MVRVLLSALVLASALGSLAVLTRASERSGVGPPTQAPARPMRSPVKPLLSAEPVEPVEEPIDDASIPAHGEEPEGPPPPIRERFSRAELGPRAREEACRVAEEVIREADLEGLKELFAAYAATRDPRVRAGILMAVRVTPAPREGIDWVWLESTCPPGGEAVAARMGIRAGLGRHGACLWLARLDDAARQRGVIDAILDGLEAEDASSLADWCAHLPPSAGVRRLVEVLEE